MKRSASTLILLLFLSVFVASFSQIGVVKAEPRTIVVPDDYLTIGWAVGNASEGDTIFVKEGTYHETLALKKSVSLVGENKETTIINGHNVGPAVYIRGDGVNVTGFTVINDDEPRPPSTGFPWGTRLTGIHVLSASNCSITNNVVANSGRGIWLYDSHNIRVVDNQIRDNEEISIRLESSSNTILVGNSVGSSWGGIILKDSGNNMLRDNTVTNVSSGFRVYGSEVSQFVNDVDFSNTIDGKPIHYFVNQKDLTINPSTYPNLDFVIVANCTNIVVQNLQLTNAPVGIQMVYTNESTLMGNTIKGTSIKLDYSSHNLLVNNTAGIILESSSYNRIANNSCGLTLQRSSYNTITGNIVSNRGDYGIYLRLSSSNNHIKGNDITNNTNGIFVYEHSDNNTIVGNNITQNGDSGIRVGNMFGISNFTTIVGNNITDNVRWGILLYFSYGNTVVSNNIANNQYGIKLDGDKSQNCFVVGNRIENNEEGIQLFTQSENVFFHNSFINNVIQVYVGSKTINEQTWDNGYPSGGNYWSDYTGRDFNKDGIGDSPYTIFDSADGIGDSPYHTYDSNDDHYPLMAPITVFDAGMWEGTSYSVDVVSNSTVSGFSFNPDENLILFSVEGNSGTTGFCRVTLPKSFLGADESQWVILVDGNHVASVVTEYLNKVCLYFTYGHSTKTVTIIGTTAIPEFPFWIILPLFVASTGLLLFAKRRIKFGASRNE